jgi:hypothetical protein
MSDSKETIAAARVLRTSLLKKQSAQKLEDPDERASTLKNYYFPIPSDRYVYILLFVNWGVAAAFAFAIGISLRPDFSLLSIVKMLACVPIALFIADLMSAGFHKWLDSYASEANWYWGTSALAYRIHHEFPKNLNRTTYLHNVSAFSPFLSGLYCLYLPAQWILFAHPYVNFTVWILVMLFANGTEIHKQAHISNPRKWVVMLQRARIFLARPVHLSHHRDGVDSDYGIINGWSHGLLRALKIWPTVDMFLWNRIGLFPRNWVQVPSQIPGLVLEELIKDPELVPLDLLVYEDVYPERVYYLNLSTTARSRLSALRSGDEPQLHEHLYEKQSLQMRKT